MVSDTQQMNIRLDPELHEQLRVLGRKQDRTLAQTVRHALKLYVEAQHDAGS